MNLGNFPNRKDEFWHFKTEINLIHYAETYGYCIYKKDTGPSSTAMINEVGNKIIICRRSSGEWRYQTVIGGDDAGDIIDFVRIRKTTNYGHIRKELRPWINRSTDPIQPKANPFASNPMPIEKDLSIVQSNFSQMNLIDGQHSYLENERCIPASTLNDPCFKNVIRIDKRGNAVFPHKNEKGICGYELKNKNFTGFAKGGKKGLWKSELTGKAQYLILAETAIDAISYAAIKKLNYAIYCSTAGALNMKQPALIEKEIKMLPRGACVIVANDNDRAGQVLNDKVKAIFEASGHAGVSFREDMPQTTGEDWNDVLRASMEKIKEFK